MSLPFDGLATMFLRLIQWMFSKLLTIPYRGESKTTPTMKNSVLMESATSLAARIRNKKVTSVEVVQSYINRIREINYILNCVVDERFESALAEAKRADEMIQSGDKTADEIQRETPLLGVPFTCPDAVAVEGLSHTMGVFRNKDTTANSDDDAVALLRSSGAIPIACTNVSESCSLYETVNPIHGRTNNPYNSNCSVGGPFGGESCLVAACGSPLGIAPSVTLSSAFNGVFGHRNKICGVISRSSSDLLPLLKILTKKSNSNLKLDEPVDLKSLKYYYMFGDGASPIDSEIKMAIQNTVNHFENVLKANVEKIDIKQLKKSNLFRKLERKSNKNGGFNLWKELMKVSFGKSEHTLLFLLTALADRYIHFDINIDSEEMEKENNQLLKTFQDILGTSAVFLCPTHPTPAHLHNESAPRGPAFGHSAVFEALGLPATHCPLGLHPSGLPIGLQVVAAPEQDRLAVAVAREIDRVFGGWKPPPSHGTFTLKSTVFHTSNNEKVKVL